MKLYWKEYHLSFHLSDLEVDMYFHWKKNIAGECERDQDGFDSAIISWPNCNTLLVKYSQPDGHIDKYEYMAQNRLRHILTMGEAFKKTERYSFNATAGIYGKYEKRAVLRRAMAKFPDLTKGVSPTEQPNEGEPPKPLPACGSLPSSPNDTPPKGPSVCEERSDE